MSKHTTVPAKGSSVSKHTSGPALIARRDGAFLCNKKHGGHGRCRKMVMSATGEVTCGNKHSIPINTLVETYLTGGDWQNLDILGIHPQIAEILLKRIATSEFLRAGERDWQHVPMSHWPFVSRLVYYAETRDRKAAAMLKDYWEQAIRQRFPILDRYLGAFPTDRKPELAAARERMFRSFAHWQPYTPAPETFLARWEAFHEAAQFLTGQSDEALLYSKNMGEAIRAMEDESHWPAYFTEEDQFRQVWFSVLPDPYWHRSFWSCGQINIIYRPEQGDMKLGVVSPSGSGGQRFANRIRSHIKFRRGGPLPDLWDFHCDSSDHINMSSPASRKGGRYRLTPLQALDVVKELRVRLMEVPLD